MHEQVGAEGAEASNDGSLAFSENVKRDVVHDVVICCVTVFEQVLQTGCNAMEQAIAAASNIEST